MTQPFRVSDRSGSFPRRSISAGLKALALGVVFALALLTSGSVLRIAQPGALPFEVRMKDDTFCTKGSGIDTVFFGSSRVYRHVIPAVFDEEMRAQGRETHSFNFGFDGMRPPESFYYIRRILRRAPRMKWVFVELCPCYIDLNQNNAQGKRTVEWHDPSNTLLVLRQILGERLPVAEKLRMGGLHLESFALRSLNLSGGMDWLPRARRSSPSTLQMPAGWRAQAGYAPNTDPPLQGARLAEFEAAVARARAHPGARPLPPLLLEPVRALAAQIRALGATPVFVIMPTVQPGGDFAPLREQGIDAGLISLAEVRRFPELYRGELHADFDHLVGSGPALLTSALAREFFSLSEQGGTDWRAAVSNPR